MTMRVKRMKVAEGRRLNSMKNLVKTGMNFWKVIHLEKKLSLYIRL